MQLPSVPKLIDRNLDERFDTSKDVQIALNWLTLIMTAILRHLRTYSLKYRVLKSMLKQ